MMVRVCCPHCGNAFRAQRAHLGRSSNCPKCHVEFELREANGAPHDRSERPVYTDGPIHRPAAAPASGLFELHEPLANQQEAEQRIQSLKRSLPEVSPAYRPSGETTRLGLLATAWASLPGAGAAALVGLIARFAELCAIVFIAGLAAAFSKPPAVFCLLGVGVFLLHLFVVPALEGFVAARVVTRTALRRGNRNVGSVMVWSAAAAALGTIVLHIIVPAILGPMGRWMLSDKSMTGAALDLADIVRILSGAGGDRFAVAEWVLAVVAAAFGGRHTMRETRYCEECLTSMKKLPPMTTSLAAGPRLRSLAVEASWGGLPDLPPPASGDGGSCELLLYRCEHCGDGFLDARARVRCQFQIPAPLQPKTDAQRAAWTFVSVRLCKAYADQIGTLLASETHRPAAEA